MITGDRLEVSFREREDNKISWLGVGSEEMSKIFIFRIILTIKLRIAGRGANEKVLLLSVTICIARCS